MSYKLESLKQESTQLLCTLRQATKLQNVVRESQTAETLYQQLIATIHNAEKKP